MFVAVIVFGNVKSCWLRISVDDYRAQKVAIASAIYVCFHNINEYMMDQDKVSMNNWIYNETNGYVELENIGAERLNLQQHQKYLLVLGN